MFLFYSYMCKCIYELPIFVIGFVGLLPFVAPSKNIGGGLKCSLNVEKIWQRAGRRSKGLNAYFLSRSYFGENTAKRKTEKPEEPL
jgi:hypothetical protein